MPFLQQHNVFAGVSIFCLILVNTPAKGQPFTSLNDFLLKTKLITSIPNYYFRHEIAMSRKFVHQQKKK